jgi:transcriptional regulator with XRE-family HTH domain
MDARSEIRDFLTSRRARITPEDVGLTTYGARRVPGLRREEVATLAGVSVDYYNRMERGNLSGASESVLDTLARALRLDDAERAHLFDLARAVQPLAPPPRRRSAKPRVRPALQQIVDAMVGVPAVLINHRQDFLAANALARALYVDMFDGHERPNAGRFIFLDPRAHDVYPDWHSVARDVVSALRSAAGRKPDDRAVTDLVGELSTRSNEFRQYWARHDVGLHLSGIKRFHHPHVGDMELRYDGLDVILDADLTIYAYTAEPGSRSAEALALLGTLVATTAAEQRAPVRRLS